MPLLLPVIETLWLQTGSCLRLLYPDYIRALKHDWRGQIIRALQAGDGDAARRAIESDIGPALAYLADLAGEDGLIQPHSARTGPRTARLAEAAAPAPTDRRVDAKRGGWGQTGAGRGEVRWGMSV